MTNRSRPIKARRTKAEMAAIREAIVAILAEDSPMTVRQMFYQLVKHGLIAKTEAEYKQTVTRLLGEMREDGEISFDAIADGTRWMRKPRSFDSTEEAMRATAQHYRRRLWTNQDYYVEVWLEKEALAGVLYPVTEQYDVPLMVSKGYASKPFLYESAREAARQLVKGKYVVIYQLGDWDPSGVDIRRVVRETITRYTTRVLVRELGMHPWTASRHANEETLQFASLALNAGDVEKYDLPTRPTKTTDSRSKGFGLQSVELDSLPAPTLRDLVEQAIDNLIDHDRMRGDLVAEESEREVLTRIAETMRGKAS